VLRAGDLLDLCSELIHHLLPDGAFEAIEELLTGDLSAVERVRELDTHRVPLCRTAQLPLMIVTATTVMAVMTTAPCGNVLCLLVAVVMIINMVTIVAARICACE
jgi:hypothetical protein